MKAFVLRAGDTREALECAFAALGFFTEEHGLARSLEISADLNNIARTSTTQRDALELRPSANARAYADYIARLGLRCTEGEDPDEIETAALRWPLPPLAMIDPPMT
jgi:hypothetical protein